MKAREKIVPIIIIMLICFLIALGIYCLVRNKLMPKSIYEISSRIENVEKTVIESSTNSNKTVGWVRIQGTSIDLPIITNEEENYPVEVEGYSWIDNNLFKFNNTITIMGHNIFNLSKKPYLENKAFQRFEPLMSFVYYSFAEKNKYFQVTMDGEDKLYKIFMVGFVSERDVLLEFSEDNYIQKIKDYSIYDYDIDVTKNDKVISLVTCTRFFGNSGDKNFYVVGREIRKNERANDYSVKKNKNYEQIDEALKNEGGLDNEV